MNMYPVIINGKVQIEFSNEEQADRYAIQERNERGVMAYVELVRDYKVEMAAFLNPTILRAEVW